MLIKPKFLATGIGSMPFDDPGYGIDLLLSTVSEAPFWPQLPKKGLHEQMEIQFCEGMPRAVIDTDKNRLYFDTSGDYSEELGDFYGAYMAAMDPDEGNGDCSALAIGPAFSEGIPALEERLRRLNQKLPFVKVQITGPCTFCLAVSDENKRALYYNEEFRDMIVKALAMKCRWQIQKFRLYADNIICFIDEPILSAFGSSTYVSVKRDDVVALLAEMIHAIHADGGIAGIHCCGNTEWSIPIDAGVDIVNFDAFQYAETIAMYPDPMKDHLQRNGILAWGVVPTSIAIREQTIDGLSDRLEKAMDHLASKGIEKQLIVEQAVITPSCGTGSMTPADAEQVFRLTGALSREMKRRYGF
jgi:methionine synthase II (cobalamin-independent)